MIKKISFVSIIIIVVSIFKYLDTDSFPLIIANKDKQWVYLLDWVYLAIFIVILSFFFTYSKWKEQIRKEIINAIIAYCFLNIIFAFVLAGRLSPYSKGPERYRYSNCWNNIRVISSAVDNYNIDSKEMMTTELDFDKLINGKYLKNIPIGSEEICSYKMYEMDGYGFVYCVKHKYPELKIFQDHLVELNDLNLAKELNDNPQLFSDEEKEFILESNKELEKREKEIKNKTELTEDKFVVLIVSLPLFFLFFPSIVFRK